MRLPDPARLVAARIRRHHLRMRACVRACVCLAAQREGETRRGIGRAALLGILVREGEHRPAVPCTRDGARLRLRRARTELSPGCLLPRVRMRIRPHERAWSSSRHTADSRCTLQDVTGGLA